MTNTNNVNLDTKMEHVRKLLALAENNPNKEEAYQALLKAQELMAKYELNDEVADKADDNDGEGLVKVACKHRDNAGFRGPLAVIIAENFRCKAVMVKGVIHFIGHRADAIIARNAFEFSYNYVKRQGEAETSVYFNSYAKGFMNSLKAELEEQSQALMIATPDDVNRYFNRVYGNAKKTNTFVEGDRFNYEVYKKGYAAGQTALDRSKLEA